MEELNNLLARYHDTWTEAEIPALAEELVTLINRVPKTKNYLEAWIKANGSDWLKNKATGLAAILEVSARYPLSVGCFFAEVLLCSEAPDLITLITVQRIRLLNLNRGLRKRLYGILRKSISVWLNESKLDIATQAIISLPYVADGKATDWLCETITDADPKLANAACLGVLDWACGCIRGVRMDPENSNKLYGAILSRLNKEKEGNSPNINRGEYDTLFATLHWVLGAVVVDVTKINEVCDIFVSAFKNPRDVEDAASVRSSRILLKRFRENFDLRLRSAFERDQQTNYGRMRECILATEYKGV